MFHPMGVPKYTGGWEGGGGERNTTLIAKVRYQGSQKGTKSLYCYSQVMNCNYAAHLCFHVQPIKIEFDDIEMKGAC